MRYKLAVISTPGAEVMFITGGRRKARLDGAAKRLQKSLAEGHRATVVPMTQYVRAHLSNFGTLPDGWYVG
jgi:hypothetical protein